jgi:hypothetical protein
MERGFGSARLAENSEKKPGFVVLGYIVFANKTGHPNLIREKARFER